MRKHNAENERVKREYLTFLREAKRQSEASVDAVAKAIARFEDDTGCRDFRTFRTEQAVAFKRRLAERDSDVTGKKLSKATLYSTLAHLKRFFQWLAMQPGYRSQLTYSEADYFNLSEKESRIATARRERPAPTMEQIQHVIRSMPHRTDIERRDRALLAFALLTGARDSALASMKLKHVDLMTGCVHQDARDVKTKNSKTFTTIFFPVGDEIRSIAVEWVRYLREDLLRGLDAPLFPATRVEVGAARQFEATGLADEGWATASPIRAIFRAAFAAAGLPYFNPHSLRRTLVLLGETVCQSPEEFKAWSQNLGHEGVLTTFVSYGTVSLRRQREVINALALPRDQTTGQAEVLAAAVVRLMRTGGMLAAPE